MTIINGGGIILMEETDKIQIGHIEILWSIGMSMDEVGTHLFGVRNIAQGFPCTLGVIIALPIGQVL